MQRGRVFASAIAVCSVTAIAASCAAPSGDSGIDVGSMSIEDTGAGVEDEALDVGMDLGSRWAEGVGSDSQADAAPVSASSLWPAPGPETMCDVSACTSMETTILWEHEIEGYVSFVRPTRSGSVVVAGSLAKHSAFELAASGDIETSIPIDSECGGGSIAAADVSNDGGMVALMAYCPAVLRFGPDRNVLWEFEFPFFSDVVTPIGAVSLPNGSYLAAATLDNGLYGHGTTWGALDANGAPIGEEEYASGWYATALSARPTGDEVLLVGSPRPEGYGPSKISTVASVDSTGKLLWQRAVEGIGAATAILTTADAAFVLGTTGLVRLDKVGLPTAGPFPTGDDGSFSHAAWTCGGDFVLTGGREGAVAIRLMSETGEILHDSLLPLGDDSVYVTALSVRPDGRLLIAAGGRILETSPVCR